MCAVTIANGVAALSTLARRAFDVQAFLVASLVPRRSCLSSTPRRSHSSWLLPSRRLGEWDAPVVGLLSTDQVADLNDAASAANLLQEGRTDASAEDVQPFTPLIRFYERLVSYLSGCDRAFSSHESETLLQNVLLFLELLSRRSDLLFQGSCPNPARVCKGSPSLRPISCESLSARASLSLSDFLIQQYRT